MYTSHHFTCLGAVSQFRWLGTCIHHEMRSGRQESPTNVARMNCLDHWYLSTHLSMEKKHLAVQQHSLHMNPLPPQKKKHQQKPTKTASGGHLLLIWSTPHPGKHLFQPINFPHCSLISRYPTPQRTVSASLPLKFRPISQQKTGWWLNQPNLKHMTQPWGVFFTQNRYENSQTYLTPPSSRKGWKFHLPSSWLFQLQAAVHFQGESFLLSV